ncbi:MAG: site-2 protease family protein [Pseudomonadota bacterium]
MQARIIELLLFYPLFLFSLSFHEAAHGFVAHKFGDPTAKFMGRVTLNPLPHLDLIGTVFLPIFGILTGAPVIGWGKPVPVNPYNFKDARKDNLWVGAFGPISNFVLALGFALLTHLLVWLIPQVPQSMLVPGGFWPKAIGAVYSIFQMGVILNLVLGCFNLLPLGPLDGGSVVRGLIPESAVPAFDRFQRYGLIILLVLFVTGFLKYIFYPVMLIASILLP